MPCKAAQCQKYYILLKSNKYVPLKNLDAVSAAYVVGNLCREAFVVHEEKVNFPDVADQELLQAIRKKVAGLESCQLSLREPQGFS